jgi:GNAT superfamily N-acetyltransferase
VSAVTLREATLDDAAGIGRVHVEGWQTTYRGLLPDAFLDDLTVESRTEFWTRPLTTRPAGWHMLVAEEAGKIVGFACGSGEWGEPRPGCEGHVNAIYVLSGHRGGGIGTRLLAALFERLTSDGCKSVSLWVLAGNDRTEAFYRALGAAELMRADKPGAGEPVPEIALGWDKQGMDGVIARARP